MKRTPSSSSFFDSYVHLNLDSCEGIVKEMVSRGAMDFLTAASVRRHAATTACNTSNTHSSSSYNRSNCITQSNTNGYRCISIRSNSNNSINSENHKIHSVSTNARHSRINSNSYTYTILSSDDSATTIDVDFTEDLETTNISLHSYLPSSSNPHNRICDFLSSHPCSSHINAGENMISECIHRAEECSGGSDDNSSSSSKENSRANDDSSSLNGSSNSSNCGENSSSTIVDQNSASDSDIENRGTGSSSVELKVCSSSGTAVDTSGAYLLSATETPNNTYASLSLPGRSICAAEERADSSRGPSRKTSNHCLVFLPRRSRDRRNLKLHYNYFSVRKNSVMSSNSSIRFRTYDKENYYPDANNHSFLNNRSSFSDNDTFNVTTTMDTDRNDESDSAYMRHKGLYDLLYNVKQQELSNSKFFLKMFHHVYKPIIYSFIIFLFFICFGISILLESNKVLLMSHVYDYQFRNGSSSNTVSPPHSVRINIDKDLDTTLYIYYRIQNFYANSRFYSPDGPTFLYQDLKCKAVKDMETGRNIRLIDDEQTLPPLNDIDTTQRDIYPCGLTSVCIFNDEYEINNDKGESISIVKTNIDYDADFATFMQRKDRKAESIKEWIWTSDIRYRVWMHIPLTPTFIKLYGYVPNKLKKGIYTIVVKDNLWPSKHWDSVKSFQLSTTSPFGGENYFLAYVYFGAGILFFLIALLLIGVKLFHPRTFGYSCRMVDMDKTRETAEKFEITDWWFSKKH